MGNTQKSAALLPILTFVHHYQGTLNIPIYAWLIDSH